jgi:hypothetical protein
MPNAKKFTVKQILLSNQNWWHFYEKYKNRIRPAIVTCIVKLLSCKNIIRGYREYLCSNPNCSHVKHIHFTCKCKACSSCGKKSTEIWIEKQKQVLPDTKWQHITFTMPCELWDFFWHNRQLFDLAAAIAANCVLKIAKKRKIIVGILLVIHTFGHDLKRNIHFHLSVTLGGLSKDLLSWKNIYFDQGTLMRIWRYQIIQLFRKNQSHLAFPMTVKELLNSQFSFNHFLDKLYKKTWIVDCAKPTSNHKHVLSYLSRYLKRPPIAESKLKHYFSNMLIFSYLDRSSMSFRNFKLTIEQFIARFIQHIPDKNFRMARYYGFLSNRTRGKLLPIVYKLLNQEKLNQKSLPGFVELMQKNFGFNPLKCILCGQQLILSSTHFGKNIIDLLGLHRELALLKNC